MLSALKQEVKTSDVLIIGYGNTLRGDDGVGIVAADKLAAVLSGDEAEIIRVHQMTPDLAVRISEASLVIFLDAREGGSPGTIICEPVHPDADPPNAFTHHVSPSGMLAWAKELYGRYPEGIILSVSGEDFGFSEELSPKVLEGVTGLVELAKGLVKKATSAH